MTRRSSGALTHRRRWQASNAARRRGFNYIPDSAQQEGLDAVGAEGAEGAEGEDEDEEEDEDQGE